MDEVLRKAKAYSKARYGLAAAETILYIVFFITLQLSGLSSQIAGLAFRISGADYLSLLAYIAIVGLFLSLIDFPVAFLSSFKLEHRFGLSRQGFSSWLKDYIKRLLIGSLLFMVMIVLLYYFLRAYAAYWWLYAGLSYFFLSVALAKIFPVIIIPLFYKLDRLCDTSLKERLLSLARKAGVKALEVYKIGLGEKTKKANAALCGWGATKRILLSDTLLQEYTEDEIEATLAHELAHYQRRHFWKLISYNFVFTLMGFGIINLYLQRAVIAGYIKQTHDLRIFPTVAVLFIIYNLLTTPLYNYISRRYEADADKEAVRVTGRPEIFARLIEKLTLQNLSDPQPAKLIKLFFYDHPPSGERIRACHSGG